MFRICLFLSLVVLALPSHADKVYRWRDGTGAVHYSDIAPPPDAQDAQHKRIVDRAPAPAYPYPVRAAMRNFPVTLYVAAGCGSGCNRAGAYLDGRGTPYTEVDALDGDNAKKLVALTGGRREVPVLVVGKSVLRGYDEAAWARALDAAGYPRTPLPKGLAARRVAPRAPVVEAPAVEEPLVEDKASQEKLVEARTGMQPPVEAATEASPEYDATGE